MPATTAQIAIGANYTLESYAKTDPIDQVNTNRPMLKYFMDRKVPSVFGNGFFNEHVYISNDSNFQNYWGADQVTYNERDPDRLAKYRYYNAHDGFFIHEDELKMNGILIDDSGDTTVMSGAEKVQLVNVLEAKYTALKEGMLEGLDREVHLDGSQSSKAAPGLDHLVSTTPTVGTVGNISASANTYWQNNINLGVASADIIDELEASWRAASLYGGGLPDKIFAGEAAIDAYRTVANATVNRQVIVNDKGGAGVDASTSGIYFKGIPIEWDPTFEKLDAELGALTYPWTKRMYLINSNTIKFRPMRGAWLMKRKPERLVDRYVHYFGQTASYGITTNKRNSNTVFSVA